MSTASGAGQQAHRRRTKSMGHHSRQELQARLDDRGAIYY
eukprot:CAMPEP_0177769336 /NCGR_PEP_ID=MMETSP0491_2-20121128/10256_1 /TAXON_ID=63592 /ORGANISM="Tetraselmis chuii, Strain PLY429" /LENGTH=39 /DNA_ID= /DNA_START= /DNA_END= /DNA_ORIENTATION=